MTALTDIVQSKICEILCSRLKKEKFAPPPVERIKEFLNFCDGLELHPFFVKHGNGSGFQVSGSLTPNGFSSSTNFDSIHLESMLTRLRQFLFPNELFFFKDLRRALIQAIGTDAHFEKFYGKFGNVINVKFSRPNPAVYYPDGREAIFGSTFKELLEDRLYRGAIHSQHLVQYPGPAAHPIVSDIIDLTLANATMGIIQNIFSFRMWILKMARVQRKVTVCPELVSFDQKCAAKGL